MWTIGIRLWGISGKYRQEKKIQKNVNIPLFRKWTRTTETLDIEKKIEGCIPNVNMYFCVEVGRGWWIKYTEHSFFHSQWGSRNNESVIQFDHFFFLSKCRQYTCIHLKQAAQNQLQSFIYKPEYFIFMRRHFLKDKDLLSKVLAHPLLVWKIKWAGSEFFVLETKTEILYCLFFFFLFVWLLVLYSPSGWN